MKYILLHKEKEVALIDFNPEGEITHIADIYNPSHLPVGVRASATALSDLNKWWRERGIPADRRESHILPLKKYYGHNPRLLQLSFKGLSLSDCYWLYPEKGDCVWDSCNLYTNSFENTTLDPNVTTNGITPKMWDIIENNPVLLKFNIHSIQEPYNELIATHLAKALNLPATEYSIEKYEQVPCSVCSCFTSQNHEFVSAAQILKTIAREGISKYVAYTEFCKSCGLDISNIDKMIVLDFLTLNNDRHFGNFGLLRDPATLKYTDVAPIFDTGSSLGYNHKTSVLDLAEVELCKPFAKSHLEQLSFVSDFSWLNIVALYNAADNIESTLIHGLQQEERGPAIIQLLRNRINKLERYLNNDCREELNYEKLESGLPDFLRGDINAFQEGIELNLSYVDGLWNELYSSINLAQHGGIINESFARYLRNKYLFE